MLCSYFVAPVLQIRSV